MIMSHSVSVALMEVKPLLIMAGEVQEGVGIWMFDCFLWLIWTVLGRFVHFLRPLLIFAFCNGINFLLELIKNYRLFQY